MNSTEKGEDMDFELFKKHIDYAAECEDFLTLGGGEPTMHPQWDIFLGYAIVSGVNFGVITNGKLTKEALRLASFMRQGLVSGGLSQDLYHERISQKVVDAFSNIDYLWEVKRISNIGRAKINGIADSDMCLTNDLILTPSGRIKWCACEDAPYLAMETIDPPHSEYSCYSEYRDAIENGVEYITEIG